MTTAILVALLLFQYPSGQYPSSQYPSSQYPTGGAQRRIPPGQNVPDTRGTSTDAVASFDGVFKIADKKYLTIELEEGQSLRMFITGKTKFYRDDRESKAADFQNGEKVTVEASRDARMNLLAVRVTAVKPRKNSDEKPSQKP